MKSCPGADRALDVNFAGMFLNDAVGDGEPKARSAAFTRPGHGLGGEEGVVDTLQVFRGNARAGVGDEGFHMTVRKGCAFWK